MHVTLTASWNAEKQKFTALQACGCKVLNSESFALQKGGERAVVREICPVRDVTYTERDAGESTRSESYCREA